jgi:prepilin-type N-terminal cleavage/methylation domain-containing protein
MRFVPGVPGMSARSQRGWSLIELLTTMMIVSILVAITVPLWHDMRERGYVAVMQSDLRNMAISQESFFIDNEYYAATLPSLEGKGFQSSAAVELRIAEATRVGWSVSATHPGTTQQCHLFVGFAAPVGTATRNGLISCA